MSKQKQKRQVKVEELSRPQEELTAEQAEAAQGGRKAGGDQQEFLKVTMEDVLISSY
jgi:hypothetical protein